MTVEAYPSMNLSAFSQNLLFVESETTSGRKKWKEGQYGAFKSRDVDIILKTGLIFAEVLDDPVLKKDLLAFQTWRESVRSVESLTAVHMTKYFSHMDALLKSWAGTETARSVVVVKHRDRSHRINGFINRVPECQDDLQEAINCISLGRATASVFHLERATESALRPLARKLKATIPVNANWQPITDRLNTALNTMKVRTPKQDLERRELALVLTHLNAVRVAFRNDVMHPGSFYTLDEAEDIFRHSVLLLEHIAKFVKPKRKPKPKP